MGLEAQFFFSLLFFFFFFFFFSSHPLFCFLHPNVRIDIFDLGFHLVDPCIIFSPNSLFLLFFSLPAFPSFISVSCCSGGAIHGQGLTVATRPWARLLGDAATKEEGARGRRGVEFLRLGTAWTVRRAEQIGGWVLSWLVAARELEGGSSYDGFGAAGCGGDVARIGIGKRRVYGSTYSERRHRSMVVRR